ncbi:MAG: hypothetical protein MR571_07010 [Succinatimonas sp.]|nr:hypothetical protein [Succinatimonas sp.]
MLLRCSLLLFLGSLVSSVSFASDAPKSYDHGDDVLNGKELSLDQVRAKLRHDLVKSKASDQQVKAMQDLKNEDERRASELKQSAKDFYSDKGRGEMIAEGDVSLDARIVSQWAREQSLKNDPEDAEHKKRIYEEVRKRYPATSAAQALQNWSSGEDLQKKRAEARQVLREKAEAELKKGEDAGNKKK